MRLVIRLLSCLVIASAAITVWTRTALVFVLGSQMTAVCLWIAVGGSVCAIITLALIRKPNRPQPYQPPQPSRAGAARRGRAAVAVTNGQQSPHARRPP